MYDKFEMLNRRTSDFNNSNIRFNPVQRGSESYFNRLNSQTFKANNGQYPTNSKWFY